jgi:hypothetical protein
MDCGNRIAKSRAKRCRACYDKDRLKGKPARPRTFCEDCGAECRGALCIRCQRRTYPSSELELTGGRWLRRGNRLVWVSVEEEIAEYTLRALMAERYGHSEWWTKGAPLRGDNDFAAALRRREIVAESERADGRCLAAGYERAERSAS